MSQEQESKVAGRAWAAFLVVIALWVGGLTVAASVSGCTVEASNVTPSQAQELAALEAAHAEAMASGDPAAIAKAEANLDAFEDKILRERAGPFVAGLAAISPALGWLSPLALAAVPLLGKRGRRNAWKGVKALKKGQIVEAALSVGRTLGALDSSKDSGAVARGEKVAVSPEDLEGGAAVGA